MYVATGHQAYSAPYLVSRCLRLARDFLVLPDRRHRWSVAIVTGMIGILIACFVRYAYVEKHQLMDSFFYGRLRFSFVDRGFPEIFGYGLELAACGLFALSAWMYRSKQWYACAAILLLMFLDDAFELHETIGGAFSAASGLSPVVGDLVGFAMMGLLSAAFWIGGARLIHDEDDWLAYLVFTAYFGVLVFFGVGVDAVHGTVAKHASQTLLTLIEDGGELATIALISLSAWGMWLRQKAAVIANELPANPGLPNP
ncbi:hypothetical protein [Pseudoxanthomonas wuyuanensis]|uniref:Uncharacterized protein n=2 Tax=Pseudoxanthomonas wuyuanensis TaxID=1073196 RepID=A0A286D7V9_9GAMM|nr:hypothetical protein [Pseudoxanthomonas wuyuanensis]SOD54740.1 hypothetical protein SAMN06296416_104352 [Pseudoxanthomonas wuyuanensis]